MTDTGAFSAMVNRLVGDSGRDRVFLVLFWGTVASFGVMVVCAWTQVISRYFFGYSLGWTEELAQIMMFWFTYLSVGVLIRRRRLMKVDAFTVNIPARPRTFLSAAIHLASAIFLAWLGYLSIRLMDLASSQISTALKIPYEYIYLSLPIGLLGAVIYCLAIAIGDFRAGLGPRDSKSDPTAKRQTRDV